MTIPNTESSATPARGDDGSDRRIAQRELLTWCALPVVVSLVGVWIDWSYGVGLAVVAAAGVLSTLVGSARRRQRGGRRLLWDPGRASPRTLGAAFVAGAVMGLLYLLADPLPDSWRVVVLVVLACLVGMTVELVRAGESPRGQDRSQT